MTEALYQVELATAPLRLRKIRAAKPAPVPSAGSAPSRPSRAVGPPLNEARQTRRRCLRQSDRERQGDGSLATPRAGGGRGSRRP
eukprot:10750184-Lingulodinium_polyedra.AAC.1